jgi:hypothetical protein
LAAIVFVGVHQGTALLTYRKKFDPRWARVALAFMLLIGAITLAAGESHSDDAATAAIHATAAGAR